MVTPLDFGGKLILGIPEPPADLRVTTLGCGSPLSLIPSALVDLCLFELPAVCFIKFPDLLAPKDLHPLVASMIIVL